MRYIFRLITIVAAVWGIYLSATDMSAFMGGSSVWLYFTIQSNLWIAMLSFLGLMGLIYTPFPARLRRFIAVIHMVLTVAITLTGMVFCFMLAPLIPNAFALNNTLTHVVVPLSAIMDFMLSHHGSYLRSRDAWYATIPPLYYLGFASLGYVLQWEFAPGIHYPYFFMNWGSPAGAFGFCNELPYMGVVYYALILFLLLAACGRLYIYLSKRIK